MFGRMGISLHRALGDSALYTSKDLEYYEAHCTVVVDHDVILQPSSYEAQVVESGTTITALYSEVGEPLEGSTFAIGDDTWKVQRITDNDRIFVTMVVKSGS